MEERSSRARGPPKKRKALIPLSPSWPWKGGKAIEGRAKTRAAARVLRPSQVCPPNAAPQDCPQAEKKQGVEVRIAQKPFAPAPARGERVRQPPATAKGRRLRLSVQGPRGLHPPLRPCAVFGPSVLAGYAGQWDHKRHHKGKSQSNVTSRRSPCMRIHPKYSARRRKTGRHYPSYAVPASSYTHVPREVHSSTTEGDAPSRPLAATLHAAGPLSSWITVHTLVH